MEDKVQTRKQVLKEREQNFYLPGYIPKPQPYHCLICDFPSWYEDRVREQLDVLNAKRVPELVLEASFNKVCKVSAPSGPPAPPPLEFMDPVLTSRRAKSMLRDAVRPRRSSPSRAVPQILSYERETVLQFFQTPEPPK